MDVVNNLSEERHSESESEDLHIVVRPLELTIERMDSIWKRVREIPQLFDDETRGKKDVFLERFLRKDTVAYEFIDTATGNAVGIIYFTEVFPPFNANGHIIFWDKSFKNRAEIVRETLKNVMDEFDIHRISCIIPTFNRAAILFAKRVGLKTEGVVQEIVLSLGKWHNVAMLGIVRSDFDGVDRQGIIPTEESKS